ncbi:MAG: class I SAM-dependent methyltransferase [Candidatus Humimicrobiaceae bacterium]
MIFQENIKSRLTGRHKRSFVFIGSDTIKNKDILDIGCSYGWFEKWSVENKCKTIIGIEPHENNFHNINKEIFNAKFIIASALNIPLENNSIDIVVIWDVLEHLPVNSEIKTFLEINRVLKNEGKVFLSTPNKNFWSCILDPAFWLAGHRHYNLKSLKEIIEAAKLKIVIVEYAGGFYELISMIFLYIFKYIFKREIPFKYWFDRKRDYEYLLKKNGFATIFLECKK